MGTQQHFSCICFICLQWKFACASTSPWEAAGLGCRLLEQKAPNFLLSLAERWDKVVTMGSHTLVYFVSLTEWWQKIPDQSVTYSWNTLNGSNQHLEKRKGKVFRAFFCHPGMEVVLHVHEGTFLHGLTVAEICVGSEVCLWDKSVRQLPIHPKRCVSSRKLSSHIEKEEGDADY